MAFRLPAAPRSREEWGEAVSDELLELAVLFVFGWMVGFITNGFIGNAVLREVKSERDSLREEVRRWRSGWAPRGFAPPAPPDAKEDA